MANINRRNVLKGLGGVLTLPLLESLSYGADDTKLKAAANAIADCRQPAGRSSGAFLSQGLWEGLYSFAYAQVT